MDPHLHSTFDFPHLDDPEDADAEATLEAIREAIKNNVGNLDNLEVGDIEHDGASAGPPPVPGLNTSQQQVFNTASGSAQIDAALKTLDTLRGQHVALLQGLDFAGVLGGMVGNLRILMEGVKRQGALVKGLSGQIKGDSNALASADPTLAQMFVPRAEYDELKAKYDDLLAMTSMAGSKGEPGSKKRKTRAGKASGSVAPEGEDEGDRSGRKRRSIKLEHLVHQMANRRLGLEYPISGFRVPGTSTLPDPSSPPPAINHSLNWVQEFRPDWTKSVESPGVKEYVDAVIGDAWAAWIGGVGEGEQGVGAGAGAGVDIAKVQEAVETYWIRLQKRWKEEQARSRGEMHQDEVTRKKQNQYRRQQSLLLRRTAAFDASPLNACKLRALYRTLLTLDFAAISNERPDPTRSYTEDQWNAYRREQLGPKAEQGHEVVDLFWLSPAARSLLILLDKFSFSRTSSTKRKGRPKGPAPLFHLPSSLWDRDQARLPELRPKDAQGLPIPGASGIVLFKFHVHPDVLSTYPTWSQGLYDNPPVDSADAILPGLAEIMAFPEYSTLRDRVQRQKKREEVKSMSDSQVKEVLLRPLEHRAPASAGGKGTVGEDEEELVIDPPAHLVFPGVNRTEHVGNGDEMDLDLDGDADGDIDGEGEGDESLTRGIESYVALSQAQAEAEARLALQAANAAAGAGSGGLGGGSSDLNGREGTPLNKQFTVTSAGTGSASVPSPAATVTAGPGPGSSLRARKQGKKGMSNDAPLGAALPIARDISTRQQSTSGQLGIGVGVGVGVGMGIGTLGGVGEDDAVQREIDGDIGFLL